MVGVGVGADVRAVDVPGVAREDVAHGVGLLEDPERAVEVLVRVGEEDRLVHSEAPDEPRGEGGAGDRDPPGHAGGPEGRGG